MDVCGHFGDLKHTLTECQVSRDKFSELKAILEIFLQKTITMDQIFFLSFRHFDKRKRKMAIWIIINSLFYIFKHKESSGADMLRVLKQDLRFHLMRERGFVPKIYISGIMEILENRDVWNNLNGYGLFIFKLCHPKGHQLLHHHMTYH